MDPGRRAELKRFGAPAAFLAAATIAVLLIKAGLNGGSSSNAGATIPTVVTTTHATRTARPRRRAPAVRYYTIQTGDTLGSVALSQKTTVAELLRLNPSITPTTLHVGQRIRVG